MKLRYPVLLKAVPPKHKTPKTCIAAFEADFEIKELSENEAPLAVKHGTNEWRSFEGRFFRRSNLSGEQFIDFLQRSFFSSHQDPFVRTHKLLMSHENYRQLKYGPDNAWPKFADTISITGIHQGYAGFETLMTQSKDLVPTPGQEAWLAEVEATARADMDSYFIVDGQVWYAVPEPVYAVRRGGGRPYVVDSVAYEDMREQNISGKGHEWRSLNFRIFSLSDEKAMLECAGNLQQDFVPPEVYIPGSLSLDVENMEMRRCAEIALHFMDEAVKKGLAERKRTRAYTNVEALAILPSAEFGRVYYELLSSLPRDVYANVPFDIDEKVEALLDAAVQDDVVSSHWHWGDRRDFDSMIQRWRENASMDLPATSLDFPLKEMKA